MCKIFITYLFAVIRFMLFVYKNFEKKLNYSNILKFDRFKFLILGIKYFTMIIKKNK